MGWMAIANNNRAHLIFLIHHCTKTHGGDPFHGHMFEYYFPAIIVHQNPVESIPESWNLCQTFESKFVPDHRRLMNYIVESTVQYFKKHYYDEKVSLPKHNPVVYGGSGTSRERHTVISQEGHEDSELTYYIPDVAIHYRCQDGDSILYVDYGLLAFTSFLKVSASGKRAIAY